MDAGNAEKSRLALPDALAGLQAGMLGVFLMIAWLMLCAVSAGYSIWVIPNLFATALYGPVAYQDRFFHSSLPGIALLLAIYGTGGIVWGVLCGAVLKKDGRRPPYFALTGAITGLLVYYCFFELIWQYADPLIPLYAPTRQLQIGHVLWGMMLARAPLYSRRIAEATTERTEVVLTPEVPAQETEEVKSGEVIL
jgi:hypothetical protein